MSETVNLSYRFIVQYCSFSRKISAEILKKNICWDSSHIIFLVRWLRKGLVENRVPWKALWAVVISKWNARTHNGSNHTGMETTVKPQRRTDLLVSYHVIPQNVYMDEWKEESLENPQHDPFGNCTCDINISALGSRHIQVRSSGHRGAGVDSKYTALTVNITLPKSD